MANPIRTCSLDDCNRPVFARGWCKSHYARWVTKGDVQASIPLRQLSRKNQICIVEGCNTRAHARTLCAKHNKRLRLYGSVDKTKTAAPGSPQRYFDECVVPHKGDECLIWPFSRNSAGYGKFWNAGALTYAHRLACETEHGPPPTKDHEAAHLCGNGHLGCCSPKHLAWKSTVENFADMVSHGTRRYGESCSTVKLTASDVLQIRSLRGRMTQKDIASRFGVSQGRIGLIQRRQSWAWLR